MSTALVVASLLVAAEEPVQPVAVRFWPGGGVSVEAFDGDIAIVGEVPDVYPATDTAAPFRTSPAVSQVLRVGGLNVLVTHDAAGLRGRMRDPEIVRVLAEADVFVAPAEASWGGPAAEVAEALKGVTLILPASASDRPEGVVVVPHNTAAVAPRGTARTIALGEEPFEMPGELATLFAAKEAACEASREVFAPLSAAQMNHRPADGSHTPRWNAEHMRGRELLFFSQIYNALDPAVPVMNMNPAQMPPDYEAAHPDWSGEREAEEMRRVEAFARRHAYLLAGLDLDKKAPGSRFWTPRGLLKQMDRHYTQHTANVRKKFAAGDWPAE